jgi:hypothetical protein
MLEAVNNRSAARVAFAFFALVNSWWLFLFLTGNLTEHNKNLWAASYGLICLCGAYRGFVHSRWWGGFKSVLGRALFVLSLGLLAQEFGQLIFSFYNIFLGIEVPYPSIADVGYFGSIPLYIAGIILLGRVVGAKYSLYKMKNVLQLVVIPAALLLASYYLFLRDYQFDFTDPLKVFLDFGYPLGQAVYISIAILIFSLSRNVVGGIMREKVLLLLLGFVFQYVADSNFLFQSVNGTWVSGYYGDVLYFVAYFVMTLGLISFFDPNIGRLVFAPIVSATQNVYSQIILKIIAEQQQVLGPVALEEASRVGTIKISHDLKQVEISGPGHMALAALVNQYEKLFGKASVEVCKEAAKGLIGQLPASEVPEVLK